MSVAMRNVKSKKSSKKRQSPKKSSKVTKTEELPKFEYPTETFDENIQQKSLSYPTRKEFLIMSKTATRAPRNSAPESIFVQKTVMVIPTPARCDSPVEDLEQAFTRLQKKHHATARDMMIAFKNFFRHGNPFQTSVGVKNPTEWPREHESAAREAMCNVLEEGNPSRLAEIHDIMTLLDQKIQDVQDLFNQAEVEVPTGNK
jgi:hypothetical protein